LGPHDVAAVLAEQCRHQVRVARGRWPAWIPWIFVAGACVSAIGLIPYAVEFLDSGSLSLRGLVFLVPALFFGWVVITWLAWPYLLSPRIVPYFTRELGPLGGSTMVAFRRGRGLYREIVALEQLAHSLGVRPLSAFGFAYDFYDQEVCWHPAADGLRTVEALRAGLGTAQPPAHAVQEDLESLAAVLHRAVEQGVAFSLVVRLHATDSLQAVCTREVRQGSFW
jgi:hypothetical protein